MTKRYYLVKSLHFTENILDPNSLFWKDVKKAEVNCFHDRSSNHRPQTQVMLQYNDEAIFILFCVKDKYIHALKTDYNSKVNEDSCVEWFVKPMGAKGYYNFELNAIGTLHVNYIVDPERDKNGKRKNVHSIPEEHARKIKIQSTYKNVINEEITETQEWFLSLEIPFDFFDLYTPIKKINGSIWQGNLYKCGDKTSHPHWAAWSPVIELNFHQPKHFGEFIFSD